MKNHAFLAQWPSALCPPHPASMLIFGMVYLLLQMGACLIVYSSAWTPEPTQLSVCGGSQVRHTAQGSAETPWRI